MSKYQRWHDQIIARAQLRPPLVGYCERHHIKPKSFGGGNDPSNIVKLTYREHFLVHWLLTKITSGEDRRKMLCAIHAMCRNGVRTGWQFETAKRAFSEVNKGRPGPWGYRHTEEAKRKTGAAQLGRKHTPEHRAKQGRKGVPKSAEHRRKISDAHIGKAGTPHTPEAKLKMSFTRRGRPRPEAIRLKISEGRKRYWQGRKNVEQDRQILQG